MRDFNTDGGIRDSFHTINNLRLYSKFSRKGKPSVIFIAGLGDSSETWNEVQHRISQVTSTLSYDRAGVGRSEAAPAPRTCLDLAEELSELLLALDMEPPYLLVGHSFGGLVARLYASLYPQTISGIVLVDAAPEFKELAYEKVLPEHLIAGNREYYENPMLNREKIDKVQSYRQVAEHARTSSIPLAIITRGLPDDSGEDWPSQAILAVEQKLQAEFMRWSTSSKQRIAGRSGHYIHHDEPDVVIEEILIMLKGLGK
ncbi:alpha/beta hydrolase [Paenibacillus thiaminolyticus]|uniref:alpha/beta fold hydrolase n=1 Tax=Paenibacillus thiaminolyticus TaxID=49283 RepID=UPI003D2BE4B7